MTGQRQRELLLPGHCHCSYCLLRVLHRQSGRWNDFPAGHFLPQLKHHHWPHFLRQQQLLRRRLQRTLIHQHCQLLHSRPHHPGCFVRCERDYITDFGKKINWICQ